MPDEAFRYALGMEWFVRDDQDPGITEPICWPPIAAEAAETAASAARSVPHAASCRWVTLL
jgi:hypothetical protein